MVLEGPTSLEHAPREPVDEAHVLKGAHHRGGCRVIGAAITPDDVIDQAGLGGGAGVRIWVGRGGRGEGWGQRWVKKDGEARWVSSPPGGVVWAKARISGWGFDT